MPPEINDDLGLSLSVEGKSLGKHDEEGAWRPWWIKLDLVSIPETGNTQIVMRCTTKAKQEVFRAATALHMDMTSFMRLSAVGLARTILAEVATNSQSTFQSDVNGTKGHKAR